MSNGSEKEFLISVRADIKQATSRLKELSNEISNGNDKAATSSKKLTDEILTGNTKAAVSTKKLAGANKDLTGSYGGLAQSVRAMAAAFGAYKIATYIKDSAVLAAQNRTLGVVLAIVGRNANKTKGDLEGVVEKVKALGITTKVANETVIRMTQLNLDLTNSTKLARVAQDAAVIGMTNSSNALDKLIHGIVTLQPEVLRNIGITISLEQEYARWAKETDRTVQSMTQAEKRQVALNAVLREGETLTGAYSSAMETAGKKLGSLARLVETAKEELGNLFQPAFNTSIETTSGLLKQVTDNLKSWNLFLGTSGLETASLEKINGLIDELHTRISKTWSEGGVLNILRTSELEYQLEKIKEIRSELLKAASKKGTINRGSKDDDLVTPTPDPIIFEKSKKELDALIASLEQQHETLNDGQTAVLAYRFSFGDLKDEMAAMGQEGIISAHRILNLSKAIEAKQKTLDDAVAAEREHQAVMKEGQRVIENSRSASEKFAYQLININELYEKGAFGATGSAEAIAKLRKASEAATDTFVNLKDEGRDAFSELTAAANGWSRDFADRLLDNKLSFKNFVVSMLHEIARITISQATNPLFQGIASAFSGTTPTPTNHAGGIVGAGEGGRKSVSPLVFAGAQRYHTGGIVGNEVPIIAKRGEGVFTEGQMKALGGAGSSSVRIVMENESGQNLRAEQPSVDFDAEGMVVRFFLRNFNRGGQIRTALNQEYKR